MIKQFNAPCNFSGTVAKFPFWVSDEYKTGNHPLFFQMDWLSKVRGGILDPKISEGVARIAKISEQNKLSFEYLFGIAMSAALEGDLAENNMSFLEENVDKSGEIDDVDLMSDSEIEISFDQSKDI